MRAPTGRTRTALAVLGWCFAAAIAVLVGLAAVSALGRGILGGGPPMTSPEQVRRELASPAPSTAGDSERPGPTGGGATKVDRTPGGTLSTGCSPAGLASLRSWSPEQGFRAQDVREGPAEEAELTFESEDTEVEITVVCDDGTPLVSTEIDR